MPKPTKAITRSDEEAFIETLETKSREQRRLVQTEMMPEWAVGVAEWLTVNPWRFLIPVSVVVYMLLRLVVGAPFREAILRLFGGY